MIYLQRICKIENFWLGTFLRDTDNVSVENNDAILRNFSETAINSQLSEALNDVSVSKFLTIDLTKHHKI